MAPNLCIAPNLYSELSRYDRQADVSGRTMDAGRPLWDLSGTADKFFWGATARADPGFFLGGVHL